jgi:hypothetical protein
MLGEGFDAGFVGLGADADAAADGDGTAVFYDGETGLF